MSIIPVPDELTHYSSRRLDEVDELAWPALSQHALDLLRSAGQVLHPEPGEVLWDAGDPYDLHLVLTGGVLLVDRRDDRVVFVIEAGDFVGELGMLMGQRASFQGVALEGDHDPAGSGRGTAPAGGDLGRAERCRAVRSGCPAALPDQNGRGRSGAGRGRRP